MIEISNLTKKFGDFTAINNLTLTVDNGTVFGLVGSNGAGKSTLLRVIAGVYMADGGSVRIDNAQPFNNNSVKSKTLFISDYPYFESSATINKSAKIYRSLYPDWDESKFLHFKSLFPINFDEKINKMSKGMQRQAAIILGLSAMPKCILFDEIFDGLDPVIRELVKKILVDYISTNNACVIIASHNLRELEDICDHVLLLHHGGALFDDEIDNLKLGIARIQFALSDPLEFETIRKELNILKMASLGKMFDITVREGKVPACDIINTISPLFIEKLPLTLEELFISEMEVAGYDIDNLIK